MTSKQVHIFVLKFQKPLELGYFVNQVNTKSFGVIRVEYF